MKEENGERKLVSRRALDLLVVGQFLLNFIALAFIIGLLYSNTQKLAETSERLGRISVEQNRVISIQNEIQLCSLGQNLEAQKAIADALGLPVASGITPPDTSHLNCEELLSETITGSQGDT